MHVETYIFADDEIGRAFRDLLVARRGAGVEVRVLYDAIGSIDTPPKFFETLTDAGVEVREFRPLDPVRTPLPWKINNRDHRKIVIVDGRTAFTGGINITQRVCELFVRESRAGSRPRRSLARHARTDRRSRCGAVSGVVLRDVDTRRRRDRKVS